MNKTKKGFTLIELIVVLAILAVIMAIAVPTAFGSIESARKAADRGSLDGFNSAIRMQAGFVAADPTETTLNTIKAAFDASSISTTTKPQSTGFKVKWVAPTENACGSFVEDASATALNTTDSMISQLITKAGGDGTPIVGKKTS